jgi:hypothetical protein
MMEDGEQEENDDNYYQMFPEYGDTAMEDSEEEEGDERASIEPADDLIQVISDAPDEYTRVLKKQYEKRDVPQLGQQAK